MKDSTKFDKYTFLIFIILSIFVFRIRDYGSDVLDFQIVFRATSWLMAFFFGFYTIKNEGCYFNRHEKLLISFFLLGTVLIPFSMIPLRSLVNIVSYIAFYIILKSIYIRNGHVESLKIIRFSFSFCIISSILIYYSIPSLGRHIYWLNDILYVSPRMSGVFSTSNAMGGFSTVFLLLIGYLWINNLDNRKLLSVTAVLATFCLVKSDSKTAMASLVIAGYFLLPSSKLKTISTVISITLFLLVAVFAFFETEMFLTAVSRHGDPNEILTFTGRTFIWPAVIEKILDQPLFGYGLGVTSIALPELSYVIGYTPAHAHNLVLQATFSLGLIGGGMCVLLLIFNFLVKKPNKLAISFTVYILVTSIPESSFLGGVAGYSIIPFLLMCIIKNENDYSYNRRLIE